MILSTNKAGRMCLFDEEHEPIHTAVNSETSIDVNLNRLTCVIEGK